MKNNVKEVIRYYRKTESRLGYDLFLGGTKHFGYFEAADSWWQWNRALRQMEDLLARALALPPGSVVLDAGCGMGDVARRLVTKYGLRVTGIDILDFNVREARDRAERHGLASKAVFQQMSYDELAFRDSSFDGAFTMETLVHASSAERVLSELFRVLRPGGRLALFEYSRSAREEMPEEAAAAYSYVNEVAAMPSFERFSHGTLETLVAKAGFNDVMVVDITSNMLPMLRAFSFMAYAPYWVMRRLGRPDKVINAMSAVEFWKYRKFFKYNVYSAVKPSGLA